MSLPQFPNDTYESFPSDFFALKAKDIDGNDVNFETLKGKKAYLICNVASECGLTDNGYKGLRFLYEKYRDQGLEVLAFPCNQFEEQEPRCELDIKNFAKNNYQATFPMFSKIDVNGPNAHDVYKFLRGNSTMRLPESNEVRAIEWNFAHFLLDKDGKVVRAFPPEEEAKYVDVIEEEVKKLLA